MPRGEYSITNANAVRQTDRLTRVSQRSSRMLDEPATNTLARATFPQEIRAYPLFRRGSRPGGPVGASTGLTGARTQACFFSLAAATGRISRIWRQIHAFARPPSPGQITRTRTQSACPCRTPAKRRSTSRLPRIGIRLASLPHMQMGPPPTIDQRCDQAMNIYLLRLLRTKSHHRDS